jgi:predicted enzyme related to lactoylglutathione lyase
VTAREHPFGHGRLAYVQIPALDVNASAAFYKDIFRWEVRGGSASHLSFTDSSGNVIGAFVTGRKISSDPGVILYNYVHGLDDTTREDGGGGQQSRTRAVPGRQCLGGHADRSRRQRDRHMAVRSAVKPTFATVKKNRLGTAGCRGGHGLWLAGAEASWAVARLHPNHKEAEPDSVVVRVDFAQRDELLAAEPDVYYLKQHYVDYACVLVRLKRVHPDALRDLLSMAWKFVNSKAKIKRKRR